ncbi:MAG: hypothetical protein KME15_03155 [Drouetiella hepatica Uher 2000/2452]|uniref:Uncharacterized protein n=1 Tax=Drouetiella hepatica Uher 2000/2452 TaxID=904376 RepID=A0A951Q991_9CYAN|nr:hypothetical protein [Drouetiella hepatica Uher 2000/2452]
MEPATGEAFFLQFLHVDTDCYQRVLDESGFKITQKRLHRNPFFTRILVTATISIRSPLLPFPNSARIYASDFCWGSDRLALLGQY